MRCSESDSELLVNTTPPAPDIVTIANFRNSVLLGHIDGRVFSIVDSCGRFHKLFLSTYGPEDGMNLRIVKYGYGMDLLIAEIKRDQLAQLEKSCALLGLFYWKRSLQNTWYLNENKMTQIFGVRSFRQMKSGNHRYLGPVLQKKSDLNSFLEDVEIFEDDQPVKIESGKISTSFQQPPPFPILTDKNVLVCHGEFYQGTTCFETQISDPFSLKHLRLHFTDCGGNGYILQKVAYKGHKIRGVEEADRRGFLKPQFIVK